MIIFTKKIILKALLRAVAFLVMITFSITSVVPPSYAQPGGLILPTPGVMITTSNAFLPTILKGLKVYPDNPFKFDFVLDTGHAELEREDLKEETKKLVKYFLASLTTPEDDIWVNLSPSGWVTC